MRKAYIIYSIITPSLLALIIGGFYIAFSNGYIKLNDPYPDSYTIHGIDVSHHQEKIDWQQLDKGLVQFAFIKATEGINHKDTRFKRNWEQAKKFAIPAGAYHYFSFCKSGEEQACNFIETVPADSTSLPPVIDLEYGGNCKNIPSQEILIREIDTCIVTLEKYFRKKVIIYTTMEFYNTYLVNAFPENPIWIRDIIKSPDLKDNRQWLFWQYYNRGKLKGINGFVDLNVFRGTKEELNALMLQEEEKGIIF